MLPETVESLLFGSSVWMRTYRSATAATSTDAAGRVRHKQGDSSQTRKDNEMKPLSIRDVDLFSHVIAQLSQQFRFKSANCFNNTKRSQDFPEKDRNSLSRVRVCYYVSYYVQLFCRHQKEADLRLSVCANEEPLFTWCLAKKKQLHAHSVYSSLVPWVTTDTWPDRRCRDYLYKKFPAVILQ